MADIEIRMLGKFEILMDGKPVLAALKQSRKATMLIQYLVLQKGEKVTHKDLTDTLWNGERSTNPDMALRAIMHRFRNMIDAEGLKELETCIITSRGYYQWNPTMEGRVDVFEMEALMEEARRQLNPAAAVARYERVLELYAGRLLPMFCNEPWVETRSLTLHVQYRIALFQVLEACKRKGENERIVKLCRRAIELPVSAPFHSSLMQPAADKLAARLVETEIQVPAIPVIANIDVEVHETPDAIREALARQAAGAVQWVRTIERMKAAGITDIVECGPGKVLTGLLRRTAPEINGHNIFDAASLAAVLEKLN